MNLNKPSGRSICNGLPDRHRDGADGHHDAAELLKSRVVLAHRIGKITQGKSRRTAVAVKHAAVSELVRQGRTRLVFFLLSSELQVGLEVLDSGTLVTAPVTALSSEARARVLHSVVESFFMSASHSPLRQGF